MGLLALYVVAVPLAWSARDFSETGVLSLDAPALGRPLADTEAESMQLVQRACRRDTSFTSDYKLKVVGGIVQGAPYYGCYALRRDTGAVWAAQVLDRELFPVTEAETLKAGGAWRWIGPVKTSGELILGLTGMIAILAITYTYYRRPRPGPRADSPAWHRWVDGVLAAIPVAGWAILALLPARSRARKVRMVLLGVLVLIGLVVFMTVTEVLTYTDIVGVVVGSLLAATLIFGVIGGRRLLAPAGLGAPDRSSKVRGVGPAATPAAPPPPARPQEAMKAGRAPVADVARPARGQAESPRRRKTLVVLPPTDLPSFNDVGGMVETLFSLEETFGLLLAFGDEAEVYGISFNGVLLHGPAGVGKTYLAKATAGEFSMNLLHVSVGDIVSKYVGESSQNIADAFALAVANIPCLLFFDEFDSIAQNREDEPSTENRRLVNQLLTSLEEYRDVRELVVMAATNHVKTLDPAVIRPGRFDRHIRVDLPDHEARGAILRAQLADRPTAPDVDLDDVTRRSEGLTPAALSAVVNSAAMAAFRESTASGERVPITTAHLLGALATRGGKDRPTVENWTWERLVLDDATKAELQQVQSLIEDPESARAYGVKPPSGLLLAGPPGTGKTTIARVLAANAQCSFYPLSVADLTSKWVGESEDNVAKIFTRARDNAPSIVFIDEIDAIAGRRGGGGGFADRLLNQLLAEMDGLSGRGKVFVVAATNRPDILDPALVRGGRLSRTITVPVPDVDGRRRLLELFTAEMPLADIDIDQLAVATAGLSGADLEALCQQAAVVAMTHADRKKDDRTAPTVTGDDFDHALSTVKRSRDASGDPKDGSMRGFLDALTGGDA